MKAWIWLQTLLNLLFWLQGILLEHREKEFGDKVNNADVLDAIKKIVPVKEV